MKKFISAITFFAALACLLSMATANAQGPGGQRRGGPGGDPAKRAGGKVTAISGSSITVETRNGGQDVINVTADTKYSRNGEAAGLSDFKVGDFVMAMGARSDSGQFVAERVNGGDQPPPGPPGRRPGRPGIGGEVQAIALSAKTITVKGRDEETLVIYTTDSTEFNRNRQAATLADFKTGDHVGAMGTRDSSGKFTAERVFGGDERPPRGPRQ